MVLTSGYILKSRARRGHNREKGLLPQNRNTDAPAEGETWNLTPNEAEWVAAQYRYWFDGEQFPETDEQWEVLEEFVTKYPESLVEWYNEEEVDEKTPEELTPEFLIHWLRTWAKELEDELREVAKTE